MDADKSPSLPAGCTSCGHSFSVLQHSYNCHLCGLLHCLPCLDNSVRQETGEVLDQICQKCHDSFSLADDVLSPKRLKETQADKKSASGSSLSSDMDVGPSYSASLPVVQPPTDYVEQQLTEVCGQLLAESQLSASWTPRLVSLSRKAVSSVFVDKTDDMDINSYVRIVKIEHSDDSLTEYVSGIAFFKNVAHKRMKTHLRNPSVLLFEGGTDFSGGSPQLLSMETVLTKEPDYTKIFLRKLTKLKLSFIVAEGSMSQWVISELTRFGVTVLINVKRSVMNMIARMTGARLLSDVDQASSKHAIGQCREVEVRNLQKTIVIMKMQDDMAKTGAIIISGPSSEELKKVKGILRKLLRHARDLRLEGSLFAQIGVKPQSPLVGPMLSQEFTFKYMATCGKLCRKPQDVAISLYSSEDLRLGQWVSALLSKLTEDCVQCGNSEVNHKEHFLKGDSMLTIRFQHRGKEAYSKDSIDICSECSLCGAKTCPMPLNLWSWEMSFYRMVSRYFVTDRPEVASCKHRFFPYSNLKFSFGMFSIVLEYSRKQIYRLLPLTHQVPMNEYYKDVASRALSDTLDAARNLYGILMEDLFQIRDCVKHSELEASVKTAIQTNIGETFLQITNALQEVNSTLPLTNLLQVYFLRRRIFLEICALKISMQAYKRVGKGRQAEKMPHALQVEWNPSAMQECPLLPMRKDEESLLLPFLGPRRRSTNQLLNSRLNFDDHSVIVLPTDWQPLTVDDSLLNSPFFHSMQAGSPTLLPGFQNTFIPVRGSDPLSIVAFALNSQKYHEDVIRLFQMNVNLSECIESELLSGSDAAFEFVFQTFDFSEVAGKGDLTSLYGPPLSFRVKAYFVRQFQAMRLFLFPDVHDFLQSISSSQPEESNKGKSGAHFHRSHDGRFIAKVVDEREFQMFADMAPNYFRHVCKNFYHNMPSRIVRIIGVFNFSVRHVATGEKSLMWILLMLNLASGISPTALTYDLKGTANSRRFVKDGEKQTKMDLNFTADMQGLPISLSADDKQLLESALWNDTLFLSKQNVIDYSLVVLLSEQEGVLTAGIIDYVRQYTFDKAIESQYKKVIAHEIPTITNPTQYKERFRQQVLQEYFLGVSP